MHRRLDVLGKDYANLDEIDSPQIWAQIYDAETTRALQQAYNNARWLEEAGAYVTRGIGHDAIWHGRVNPKGCYIFPPPETPDLVVVGAHGGYRPGPTASAQGTRLQGRATTMGLTWGASQIDRRGASSRGGRGRR